VSGGTDRAATNRTFGHWSARARQIGARRNPGSPRRQRALGIGVSDMRPTSTAAITIVMLLGALGCRRVPDTSAVIIRSESFLSLILGSDGSAEPAYNAAQFDGDPEVSAPPSARWCSEQIQWDKAVVTVHWHVDRDCSVMVNPGAHAAGRELHLTIQTIPR